MKNTEVPIPVSMQGEPEHILADYRRLVQKGESPGMASILASRCAPGLETATNHYVGMRPLNETAGLDYAEGVKNQARKAGIPINEHSRYNGTIADARRGGDPGAWIHNGESHDKFRKVCEQRGIPNPDLRTRDDGRIHEIEAKRVEGVTKRRKNAAAREEFVADKKKKLGIPV